jgi:hypothetical protein
MGSLHDGIYADNPREPSEWALMLYRREFMTSGGEVGACGSAYV